MSEATAPAGTSSQVTGNQSAKQIKAPFSVTGLQKQTVM